MHISFKTIKCVSFFKIQVEAYSHVALQKLPPVLILHLKRIVYNKNGGCKKVMKKTDYPIELELSKGILRKKNCFYLG